MANKTPPMKSIQRAFRIGHALWELRGAGPSEIANHLDLSKSTAHIYLRSLESTGYVVNHGGKYELSYQFLTMGSRLKYRNRLFQVSQSEVRTLAQETSELVTLFVEQAGRSIVLHQEMGDQSLELGMYPGLTLPLHSHAPGKLFLAQMDQDRIDSIIEKHGLEQMTEDTITDKKILLDEIEQIRKDGYAFDWDQQIQGMGAIAVPIIVENDIEGVLAIACPTGRISAGSYYNELLQKLQESVDSLTIKYQYGA